MCDDTGVLSVQCVRMRMSVDINAGSRERPNSPLTSCAARQQHPKDAPSTHLCDQ